MLLLFFIFSFSFSYEHINILKEEITEKELLYKGFDYIIFSQDDGKITDNEKNMLLPKKQVLNQPFFQDILFIQLQIIEILYNSIKLYNNNFSEIYLFTNPDLYINWKKNLTGRDIVLNDIVFAQDIIFNYIDCYNKKGINCQKITLFNIFDPYLFKSFNYFFENLKNNIPLIISMYDNIKSNCNQNNIIYQKTFSNLEYENIYYDIGFYIETRKDNLIKLKDLNDSNLLGIHNIYYEMLNILRGLTRCSYIEKNKIDELLERDINQIALYTLENENIDKKSSDYLIFVLGKNIDKKYYSGKNIEIKSKYHKKNINLIDIIKYLDEILIQFKNLIENIKNSINNILNNLINRIKGIKLF